MAESVNPLVQMDRIRKAMAAQRFVPDVSANDVMFLLNRIDVARTSEEWKVCPVCAYPGYKPNPCEICALRKSLDSKTDELRMMREAFVQRAYALITSSHDLETAERWLKAWEAEEAAPEPPVPSSQDEEVNDRQPCGTCGGSGEVEAHDETQTILGGSEQKPCPDCAGSGASSQNEEVGGTDG